MSVESMTRRLDRMGGGLDDAGKLLAAIEGAGDRTRAWRAAGNTGPMPLEPMTPPPEGARRSDREWWRKLAEGRARVAFLRAGEFNQLRFNQLKAAYAMSDADLCRAVTEREAQATEITQ
jgi:hypothetical protein